MAIIFPAHSNRGACRVPGPEPPTSEAPSSCKGPGDKGGVQFHSLSRASLFVTPWTAARQASLSITNSWSLPKPIPIESVIPSNHFILCCPLLLLPSIFPSIRVFLFVCLFVCLFFLQLVSSSYQGAKIMEAQLQHQSFQ